MAEESIKIYTHQRGGQERFVRSNVDVCFFGGVLNPQPITSLIATPNGFISMGEVKEGDIICNPNGGTQYVNYVVDKGYLNCVEFTLDDGRKVQGALSHRWVIMDECNQILDLMSSDIIGNLNCNCPLYIPTTSFDKCKEDKVAIQSYKYIGNYHCKCINVSDEEHTYLTDGHVITRNCGKTAGAILSVAEWSKIPTFRGVFTRRNLGDAKAGGGVVDEFKFFYGDMISSKVSESPRITFPSGAYVDITHISNENPEQLMERVKGWQYDLVSMEELTSYEWSTFNTIITRNRGKAGIGSKIRATTNPKRNHWVRTFIDDYIGFDGLIKPDWDGKIRYFYIYGETEKEVAWGDTKEEVYLKCKKSIDAKLKALNKKETIFTYDNFIKSFTFYLGNMAENTASIANNKDYVGSVAAAGGKQGQILLEGNWNIVMEDENVPFPYNIVSEVFNNDPMTNGSMWITCDLADYGTDNFIAIVWNGLHVIDIRIIQKSTPRLNADRLKELAMIHGIGESHIIFDANNGMYILDYIPNAKPYLSIKQSAGEEMFVGFNLKDCCALRLEKIIKSGMLSFDPKIANMRYIHTKNKSDISLAQEFIEECSVVRFKELPTGKKRLFGKKEMNASLGKGRSMDVFDPILMRMMPLLEFKHGDELSATAEFREEKKRTNYWDDEFNEFAGDPDNSYLYSQSI